MGDVLIKMTWRLGALVCGVLLAGGPASAAPYDVEVLLGWAERTWPTLFPGPQPTQTSPPYTFRCYPTGNCAGVADGTVYIHGPVAGGGLQAVGPMAQFECQAVPENCPPPELPRLAAYTVVTTRGLGGAVVGRDSGGRMLVMGDLPLLRPGEGVAIAGSATVVLSTTSKQFVPFSSRGLFLEPDGRVLEWGQYIAYPTLGSHVRPLSAAASFDWPSDVIALSQRGYALRADRTIWASTGENKLVEGSALRPSVQRQPQPPGLVVAFASGAHPRFQHVVTREGEVWRLGGNRVAGVADAVSADCQQSSCVAVLRDGRVVFWWEDGIAREPPSIIAAGLNDIRAAAASPFGILAVDRSGQLKTWSAFPGAVTVAGFRDVTDIACAPRFCAIRRGDGTLWGFGVSLGSLHPADPDGAAGSPSSPVRLAGFNLP